MKQAKKLPKIKPPIVHIMIINSFVDKVEEEWMLKLLKDGRRLGNWVGLNVTNFGCEVLTIELVACRSGQESSLR